jgi:hypothetical protein
MGWPVHRLAGIPCVSTDRVALPYSGFDCSAAINVSGVAPEPLGVPQTSGHLGPSDLALRKGSDVPKKLPEDVAHRLVSLVIGQDLRVSEARSRMASGSDGGAQISLSRSAADRILRDARGRMGETPDVETVAGRVLVLLSLELERIEAQTGPRDLERLHRIGQTLATVDRLKPKAPQNAERPSLLELAEEGSS